MTGSKVKLGFYLSFAVLCGGTSALLSATEDRPLVEFEGAERKILERVALGIRAIPGSVSKIVEHYKALHLSLHEVGMLQKQQESRSLSLGDEDNGLPEGENVQRLETAEEHAQCQEILGRLRKNLGMQAFKSAHMNSGKFHSIIHKLLHARFKPQNPQFESMGMAFLKLPADNLEARIEKFFADIKTFGALSQFLSEMTVLLESMRTHLPGGDKLFERLAPPSPAELANARSGDRAHAKGASSGSGRERQASGA